MGVQGGAQVDAPALGEQDPVLCRRAACFGQGAAGGAREVRIRLRRGTLWLAAGSDSSGPVPKVVDLDPRPPSCVGSMLLACYPRQGNSSPLVATYDRFGRAPKLDMQVIRAEGDGIAITFSDTVLGSERDVQYVSITTEMRWNSGDPWWSWVDCTESERDGEKSCGYAKLLSFTRVAGRKP